MLACEVQMVLGIDKLRELLVSSEDTRQRLLMVAVARSEGGSWRGDRAEVRQA